MTDWSDLVSAAAMALLVAVIALAFWLFKDPPCTPATWIGATAVVCRGDDNIQAGTYVLVEPGKAASEVTP